MDENISKLMGQGYSCSQIVLLYFRDRYGLSEDLAISLAAGLESGHFQAGTCGALGGAILVLGLDFYQGPGDRSRLRDEVVRLTGLFEEKMSSSQCRDLMEGLDLSTSEGLSRAKEKGLVDKVCPRAIETAINLLKERID